MEFKFKKALNNAVAPTKANPSDTGFDLCLISKFQEFDHNVVLYDTGIIVEPPQGYYFDIVPRSSIIKYGYMLANSVGIIDSEYRGTIKVPLTKISDKSPELVLPARLIQLIPRRIHQMTGREVTDFSETNRGEGGFGSSGSANTVL
jgi:dUTP pyrophosphatase